MKLNLSNKKQEEYDNRSTKFIKDDIISNYNDFDMKFIDENEESGFKVIMIPANSKFKVHSVRETFFDPVYVLEYIPERDEEGYDEKFVTSTLQITKSEDINAFRMIYK